MLTRAGMQAAAALKSKLVRALYWLPRSKLFRAATAAAAAAAAVAARFAVVALPLLKEMLL
jgi:hypothetical protein